MSSDLHATSVDIEKVDEEQITRTEGSELVEFPEGGLRAWLVLVGSFIAQFCSFGYLNSFGVYQDYYVREYLSDFTASRISWIGSTQLFLIMLMGIPSGRAFDAGYFYHITIAGSLLFTFSLFMLSLSHPQQFTQVFLAQGIANSIAIGMIYIPSLGIVSHYFKRRRAVVMGISAAGSAVGGALHPIMLNQLFHEHGGNNFHNGVRASALFNFCCLLIAILFMKPRLPPKRENSGLLTNVRTFIREPAYVLTMFGTCTALAGVYFPIFFLQLYAIKQGVSPNLAFYTLTILNGTSAIGRIAPNLLVNKYGIMNALLLCVVSAVVMIFAMLAVKTVAGVILFGIVYGFFTGAYIGLLGPLLSSFAKKNSEIGARIGICFAFAGVGGLIGDPIAGALLTSSFDWWRPTLFAGMSVTVSAGCFFAARLLLSKEKGTAFV